MPQHHIGLQFLPRYCSNDKISMVCFTCKPLSSSSSLTAASTILSPLSSLPQNECCHSPLEVLQCCNTTKGNTCQNLSFSAQVATAPPSRPSHRQSIFSFGRVASCKFHINNKSLFKLQFPMYCLSHKDVVGFLYSS